MCTLEEHSLPLHSDGKVFICDGPFQLYMKTCFVLVWNLVLVDEIRAWNLVLLNKGILFYTSTAFEEIYTITHDRRSDQCLSIEDQSYTLGFRQTGH
jgi:hypothetical protein